MTFYHQILADRLEKLMFKENAGEDIPAVRGIVDHLKNDDWNGAAELAKLSAKDTLRYPTIHRLLDALREDEHSLR